VDAESASFATANDRLRLTEIFYSIQGEAQFSGWPTVFVRLTGCPLRCDYCDTAYAFTGGEWRSIDSIVSEVAGYATPYVCVTGGEPLAQRRFGAGMGGRAHQRGQDCVDGAVVVFEVGEYDGALASPHRGADAIDRLRYIVEQAVERSDPQPGVRLQQSLFLLTGEAIDVATHGRSEVPRHRQLRIQGGR